MSEHRLGESLDVARHDVGTSAERRVTRLVAQSGPARARRAGVAALPRVAGESHHVVEDRGSHVDASGGADKVAISSGVLTCRRRDTSAGMLAHEHAPASWSGARLGLHREAVLCFGGG